MSKSAINQKDENHVCTTASLTIYTPAICRLDFWMYPMPSSSLVPQGQSALSCFVVSFIDWKRKGMNRKERGREREGGSEGVREGSQPLVWEQSIVYLNVTLCVFVLM